MRHVDSATLDNGIGSIAPNSSLTVYPVDSTTYKLNAQGYFGEKSANKLLDIIVVQNSIINLFSVNKNKFTIGESALFNWTVKNSEKLELLPYGLVDRTQESQSVLLNTIGNFDYTLKTTSYNNTTVSSNPVSISVYGEPTISTFTVNNKKTATVEKGDDIKFDWTTINDVSTTLDGVTVTGKTSSQKAPDANKTYKLNIINGAGKSIEDSIVVNIVEPVAILSMTSPINVFANAPFTMNWTGTGISKYELSSSSGSGIDSKTDLGVVTTKIITPTTAGSYTYTLTAKNLAEKSTTKTSNVTVESDPTLSEFTVNGQTSITVAPSANLNFEIRGQSSGSVIQGRNSAGTADFTLPTTASATAGTTTYYASSTKNLNSIVRYSTVKSVSVIVVNAPTITSITAPTPVFTGSPFTMSWAGTNATNYKIKSNYSSSGIAVTDVDLGTATSSSITPTSAGTYTYTITATNAAGVTVSSTKQVVVEPLPTFTGFTVNGSSSVTVSPSTTLTFLGSGFSTGATLQGRNTAGTADSVLPTTASATAGTTTYYASANKTVNGVVQNSAIRSVSVTVVSAPTITSITAPTPVFTGSPFTMSWVGANATNYKIKSNYSSSGITVADVDLGTATSSSITPTSAGTYTYTITATNAAGVAVTSTKQVVVEQLPTFTGFTVNGSASVTVAPSTTLTFLGSGFSTGATLQGRNSAGTADSVLPTTASATAGTTTYYASANKTVNGVVQNSAIRSVSVTVVSAPTITSITAPTPVFTGSAFTMSWVGANATNYKIKSNYSSSGITVADVDLGTATSSSITPTSAGTYTYTITATNAAGVTVSSTKQVVVEALPTFTGFTVNGSASITVAPSTTLTFLGSGFSTGATLQARNSAGSANATFPTTASPTAGTTTYYASATKAVNGVTNYSAIRSVTVVVVASPTITTLSAPTPVFSASAFTMSWAGTNATNYKIKSNNATSGVAVTDLDLGTATSRAITPTAAGTYTYTITATNSIGLTTTKTVNVVVESVPTITTFTANPTTVTAGGTSTFSWAVNNAGTLSINQSVGTVTGTSKVVSVGSTAGSKVYTLTNSKTLNGVTKTDTKSVTLNITTAKECLYSRSPLTYYGYTSKDYYGSTFTTIYWKGTRVAFFNPWQTSYTTGGYTYTVSTLIDSGEESNGTVDDGDWEDYEVCRTPS